MKNKVFFLAILWLGISACETDFFDQDLDCYLCRSDESRGSLISRGIPTDCIDCNLDSIPVTPPENNDTTACSDCGPVEEPGPTPQVSRVPEGFVMAYSTSFEDVEKKTKNTLDWDFPHWFEFAAMHRQDGGSGNGNGGAWFWVDTELGHTGSKSIGLEVYDIEKSRRSEFLIFPEGYIDIGKEYYVSFYLYFPEDFGLYEPNINWDWLELGDPFHSGRNPYGALFLTKPDDAQENFNVTLGVRNEEGVMSLMGDQRMPLRKGQWIQVDYYVRLDKYDGAIKIWFDDVLIADRSGFPTEHSQENDFKLSIAKIYHERGDKVKKRLWIDDLAIYTKR